MSAGAYAADKCLAHPSRIDSLRRGEVPYPVHLHLIPSDYCNLNCPGCAYRAEGFRSTELYRGEHGEKNPKRFLPWHVMEKVLRDCALMGTRGIEITGGGEPTLYPQIVNTLRRCDELGLQTALITNGLMLHRQDLKFWATKCAWVRVSLDASTADTYDRVRPPQGSGGTTTNFDRILVNLAQLRALRDSTGSGTTIGTSFVVQKENFSEIYGAALQALKSGADNIRFSGLFSPQGESYFDGWRGQAEAMERLAYEAFHRPDQGFRVFDRFKEKVQDLHGVPEHDRCWYMGFTLYLGADGVLYTCCNNAYTRHGALGSVIEAGGLKALLDRVDVRLRIKSLVPRAECPQCQFRDRLRAIEAAVKAPEAPTEPPPGSIIHSFFV